jgi:acetyl-CoA acyltransferase
MEVFIVEAARTPIGRFRGALAGERADHLGAHLLNGLVARGNVSTAHVDDVIFGCVTQVGEQSANVARTSLLSAGWPIEIPGMTVDRKCGSSEAAIHVGAAQIGAGVSDVVVAGGVESMSRVPMGGNRDVHGAPFGGLLLERYKITSQGEAAERIADIWRLTRDDLDKFALRSHHLAAAADDRGWFDREIIPVDIASGTQLIHDETIRRDTSLEKLAALKPSFRSEGRITAGNASQISDCAAAVLLMSHKALKVAGAKPRARIVATTTVGSDPVLMLTGPIAATKEVLRRANLSVDQIDLFEVNEAFASVPLVWMRETGVGLDRLNVNGGAIALGHPLGASGARIMTTLLHELERRQARFGLQAICCAGGLGTATIIERLD